MSRLFMLATFLLAVMGLGGTDAVKGDHKTLPPDIRERTLDSIEYLLGEIEFFVKHGHPRSIPGEKADGPK